MTDIDDARVEAVAIAIFTARSKRLWGDDHVVDWARVSTTAKAQYRREVRSAITADDAHREAQGLVVVPRKATDAMAIVGNGEFGDTVPETWIAGNERVKDMWKAMIRAGEKRDGK